jgi:hypothetical protein
MFIFIKAFLIGAASGLRALIGLAAVSWAAYFVELELEVFSVMNGRESRYHCHRFRADSGQTGGSPQVAISGRSVHSYRVGLRLRICSHKRRCRHLSPNDKNSVAIGSPSR